MKKLVGIVCLVLGFAANAKAAEIAGTLNFVGTVTVTATGINWANSGAIPNAIGMQPSTGYFAGLDTEVTSLGYASAIDLTAPFVPIAGFLHDFKDNPEVANDYDDLTFDLLSIVTPVAPACVAGPYNNGDSCSLGVFTLTQTASGKTTIVMDITGQFVDPTFGGGAITPASGTYSADRNLSIQQIVNIFSSPGGSIGGPYSATITSVPEPATLLTFGAGTALLAAHRRRRAKKNAQA
jgi:hypothetical protein